MILATTAVVVVVVWTLTLTKRTHRCPQPRRVVAVVVVVVAERSCVAIVLARTCYELGVNLLVGPRAWSVVVVAGVEAGAEAAVGDLTYNRLQL